MKATGIVRRIDDLGRVVIPKELRRSMHIREGDPLEIFTDKDGELILKKYSPVGELGEFAAQLCDSLRRGAGGIAAVCDRDSVIAVAGGGKKELLDKPVSPELEQIMAGRGVYRSVGGGEVPVSVEDGSFCVSVAVPVLSEGDVLGCVLFVAPRGSAAGTELELKLAQTAAIFLGKQFDTNL
jgi:AbrB family transcriptional regulator (stage V sporulation protein T)